MKITLDSVKTKNRSLEVLQDLDEVLKASYSKNFSTEVLKELPISFSKKADVSTEIIKAKDSLLAAKILDLTIAVEPEEEFISKIYSWFSKNGFDNFLLDIHVEPKIHGGVQISFNGKYVDLSFNKKVAEYARK